MKSLSKILVASACAALLAVAAAPVAKAQCSSAALFASIGNAGAMQGGFKQVSVSTAGVDNTGKEIGRFWVGTNSGLGNNFAGTCPSTNTVDPSSSWWDLVGGTGPDRGINGFFTGGTCTLNTCPDPGTGTGDGNQEVFLVEEWGPGGPPGVGGTAFWVAFRVDGTPAAARIWDLSRVTGNPPVNTVLQFLEFPTPLVTASQRNVTGGVDTTNNYVDIGLNMHSGVGTTNSALPDNATVKAYDLCTFHGTTGDPGRLRTSWNCTSSVTYTNAAVTGNPFKVACADVIGDTWVAIGVTFTGGAGPDVKSALVGRAIKVECDPTIADPEPVHRPGLRPTPKKGGTAKPVGRTGR
jgi:hypothetical protein